MGQKSRQPAAASPTPFRPFEAERVARGGRKDVSARPTKGPGRKPPMRYSQPPPKK